MDLKGPDTGSVLALNAIGKQDTFLLHDSPTHSFFNYEYNQHTNFTKYHKSVTVSKPSSSSTTWPFGESIKVTLNPQNMGDLLSNMYVYLEFPAVESNANIADQIGRHVIETVTMRVDELELEKYHDDWGIIYDELYLDASEKRTKRYTLNRNQAEGTSHINDATLSRYPSQLMIPIPLFFSRKYEGDEYASNSPNRPYFPTCAIHKQKLEFEIKFRPATFFTNNPSWSTLTLDKFSVITEEITVSAQEKTFLTTKQQVLITDVVKKHPSMDTELGEETVKLQLVPDIPVKSIFWFLRRKDFEDETEHGSPLNLLTGDTDVLERKFENRYNFSTSNTFNVINEFFRPVQESAKLYINGQDLPNINNPDHTFYKYVVPYNSRLSKPDRNIYTYTFAMNPINVEPSGSLDFSKLNSDRTILDITLTPNLTNVYTLNMYYVGYQTFLFDRGFMSGVGMSANRYIPTPDDFNVTPSGPLRDSPKPVDAGAGNVLQLKKESTSFGIEGYSL
jgi:hypothetical protein